MTEDEMRELTELVGRAMHPYAMAGKIAGFHMVVAIFETSDTIVPLIVGAEISPEVRSILRNPDFAAAAEVEVKVPLEKPN